MRQNVDITVSVTCTALSARLDQVLVRAFEKKEKLPTLVLTLLSNYLNYSLLLTQNFGSRTLEPPNHTPEATTGREQRLPQYWL